LKDKDYIKDLFKDSLENLESPVRPELWNAVASSISASSASALGSTIFSSSKLIIASVSLLITIGGFTYYLSTDSTPQKTFDSSQKINESSLEVMNQPSRKDKTSADIYNIKKINSNNQLDFSNQSYELPVVDFTNSPIINTVVSNSNNPVLENHSLELASNIIEQKPNQTPVSTPLIEETNQSINNIETTDYQFVLPNVFTPNNDGSNDKFEIKGLSLTDFSLVIINSKNETIFQTTENDFSWDGHLQNGDLAPSGNYIYYIVGKTFAKKDYTKISQLTIIY
jgi:gliding motility-associated-like protein